jgi:hypothetical protein
MGHFDYAKRGIIDHTHLRFFTCNTLIDLVKGAGLDIISIIAMPIPLELVFPFFATPLGKLLLAALAWSTYLLPTLLGYQFIVEAKKHDHTEME